MSKPMIKIASDAGLLATFYGDNKATSVIAEHLIRVWQLEIAENGLWSAAEHPIWLNHFTPAIYDNTGVVQIALNAPEPIASGWETVRKRLEAALGKNLLSAAGLWGYTLVYQAILVPNVPAEEAGKKLSAFTQRLYADEDNAVPILASSAIPGGYLWLTEVPILGSGNQAAIIYLALGPKEEEGALKAQMSSPGAPLLMTDLEAHKGYQLHRQYHENRLWEQYASFVERLSKATSELLDNISGEQAASVQLDAVAKLYDRVVGTVPILSKLRIQVTAQLANFDLWAKRATGGDILTYHRNHLATSLQELELFVAQGRDALDATGTTVEMVQARLTRTRAQQERRLEMLLALFAVALAVPDLVNQQVAAAILQWLGVSVPASSYPIGWLVSTQLIIIVIVAIVVYLLLRVVSRH